MRSPEYLADLAQQITETDLGRILERRPRYGFWLPENMTALEWEQLLDGDVNNLHHNWVTATLAYSLCQIEGCPAEVTQAVMTTAALHDIPEAKTGNDNKGDIPLNLATSEVEKKEYKYLRQLASDPSCPIDPESAELAIAVMKDSKKVAPKTEAGKMFWLTERLGYFRTAVIAYDAYEKLNPQTDTMLRERMVLVWSNILGNSYAKLINKIDEHESIVVFFKANADKLNNMITITNRSTKTLRHYYLVTEYDGQKIDPVDEIQKVAGATKANEICQERCALAT